MKIVYSSLYQVDIGLHVFPTRKYRLVRDALLARGVVSAEAFVEAAPAAWDDLALVHTEGYLEKLRRGTLTREEVAQLELPWSAQMVDGFRVMVGGTILAARLAIGGRSDEGRSNQRSQERCPGEHEPRHRDGPRIEEPRGTEDPARGEPGLPPAGFASTAGVAASTSDVAPALVCHLGGGLHHAFPNHGEGFCPFNDVAVAVRVLQRDSGIERVAIVDLDVHHGNGTAFVFESDPSVFTFSMHQQHNYPMWKPRGALDIGLPDGAHDATYLEQLGQALPKVFAHGPQCVFYLAGADPYEDDQLGGLRLTKHGLRQRDRMVIHAVRDAGVPLVILLAGGYARHVDDTVEIHASTIEEAAPVSAARPYGGR